ncbi:MMPL family transporter [Streptomyces fumanus]|nr:MMPL family transporter [Streptomyces fumanus]
MIFLVKGFTPGLKIPGSQSQKTTEAMARAFPGGTEQATGTIVFQTKNGGKVTAEPAKQTIEDITQEADGLPGVGSATAPSRDTLTISPDATVGITTITFDAESASDIPTATLSDLSALAGKGRGSGLNVELAGAAVPAQEENPASQAGTLLVTLLVLLFVFRSVRTAIIPICTAMAAVGLGTCAVLASTGFLDMHSTAMTLSSMLGLAVGVDYALFIMSRHQQQVLRGMDPEESAGRAVGTAGNAVVIAGATVIVALAGLAVARIPFVTVMGLAAAFTVTMSVLISLTLVPACLGFRGAKIKTSVIPFLRRRSPRGTDQSALGLRWARSITRLRIPALLIVIVGLGALSVPVLSLKTGLNEPQAGTASAQKIVDGAFGPGHDSPLVVLVQGSDDTAISAARELVSQVDRMNGVVSVTPPRANQDGTAAVVSVTPAAGPESEQTKDLLKDIRQVSATLSQDDGTTIGVTGKTAVSVDVSQKLSDALPLYCLLVIGLAVLLLTMVFRSVVLALKAAAGFLLSIGATIGLIVGILQWGWLGSLLGIEAGPVISFVPLLLVAVMFGLAMDYQIFLVSRMREEYTAGHSAVESMQRGFAKGARVVTSAAMIMLSVFLGSAITSSGSTKGIGLGLAAGVFFDAFIVRMLLIPAAMAVFRDKAWWLPRPLGRIVPNLDVEGAALERRFKAQEQQHLSGQRQGLGDNETITLLNPLR